jgi:hypothetical protein
MRPIVLLVFACVCALAGGLAAFAGTPADEPQPPVETTTVDSTSIDAPSLQAIQAKIRVYRRRTWRWERVMGRPLTRRLKRPPAEPADRVPAWRRVAARRRWLALHPPHRYAWVCIHRYEADWRDSGYPYYGGLQMDIGFQRTYGRRLLLRKGTAEHWTPLEQMWVAERALRAGRGFWPWPNTARSCGLL